jgi:hypothetical protein
MFSICTKGIADFLNLIPGAGTARLMSLKERREETLAHATKSKG